MFGLVEWAETKSRRFALPAERMLLGVRFSVISIFREEKYHPLALRRRAAAAAKALARAGVRQAVFPCDFPFLEAFEKRGILPVSDLPLRRELASAIVAKVMAQRGLSSGSATIAVAGDRLTGELCRAVTELALRNRYVLLSVPAGGEELCRDLRRQYGVSVLQKPAEEQLEHADILLLFSPRGQLHHPNSLPLYEGAENAFRWELTLPGELARKLPAEADCGQLYGALWAGGGLPRDGLSVEAISSLA